MLLNHYTACLEKHVRGELASLINENGTSFTFASIEGQAKEALLPMLIHQVAEIIFGSDNAAETGESYRLKNLITSGMNVALTRNVVNNTDGSRSSIAVANITNVSSAPITIGEIGSRRFTNFGNTNTYVIFDRTPLVTPLTIQPGEVGRIVYTITMA